jgi:hypothetical protein
LCYKLSDACITMYEGVSKSKATACHSPGLPTTQSWICTSDFYLFGSLKKYMACNFQLMVVTCNTLSFPGWRCLTSVSSMLGYMPFCHGGTCGDMWKSSMYQSSYVSYMHLYKKKIFWIGVPVTYFFKHPHTYCVF